MITVDLGGWVETLGGESMPGGWTRFGYGYKAERLPSEQHVKHSPEIGGVRLRVVQALPGDGEEPGSQACVAIHRGVTRALLRIEEGSIERQRYGPRNCRIAFEFEIVDNGEEFGLVVRPYRHRLPQKMKGARNPLYWPRPA